MATSLQAEAVATSLQAETGATSLQAEAGATSLQAEAVAMLKRPVRSVGDARNHFQLTRVG